MRTTILIAATAMFAFAPPAASADVTIEMFTKHPETNERNVYAPELVQIEPGDTVTWKATDRGHNIEFVTGAVPEGVDRFRSPLNKDVSYSFETPGIYVYKCTPHYGLGMVGVVVVGDPTADLETIRAKNFPGKAAGRIKAILDEIG